MLVMPSVGSGRYSPGPGMVYLLVEVYQVIRTPLAICSLIRPGNPAIDSKIGSFWGNAFRSRVGTLELRSTCVQSNRLGLAGTGLTGPGPSGTIASEMGLAARLQALQSQLATLLESEPMMPDSEPFGPKTAVDSGQVETTVIEPVTCLVCGCLC